MAYGSLSVDTLTSSTGQVFSPSSSVMKNRIINGAMVIDQRNAGASVTIPATSITYTVDRWAAYGTAASKFSVQQNAGSINPPAGYTNYLGVTSSSAYSVGASEQFKIWQVIEGYNMADLAWGTANAKSITLSFWVRSSLTGTFGGYLRSGDANTTYPFTYTISSANAWQQISLTVVGPTTGTWYTTNGIGISVAFGLGIGSSLSGNPNAWGGYYEGATGATSVVGTNGATFYITGVQLEIGTVATQFEYRQYGTELALCQRYCIAYDNRSGGNYYVFGTVRHTASTSATIMQSFPVRMRAKPNSATFPATVNGTWFIDPGVTNFTTISVDQYSDLMGCFNLTGGSGLTTGQSGRALSNGTAQAYVIWDAEL
jgi:hypothetical protein